MIGGDLRSPASGVRSQGWRRRRRCVATVRAPEVARILAVPTCRRAGRRRLGHRPASGPATRAHEDIEVAHPARPVPGVPAGADRVRSLPAEGCARSRPSRPRLVRSGCSIETSRCGAGYFLEPGDDQTWVSHRDARITLPLAEVRRRTPDGIPYLAGHGAAGQGQAHARQGRGRLGAHPTHADRRRATLAVRRARARASGSPVARRPRFRLIRTDRCGPRRDHGRTTRIDAARGWEGEGAWRPGRREGRSGPQRTHAIQELIMRLAAHFSPRS